jgi:hypothetical protein
VSRGQAAHGHEHERAGGHMNMKQGRRLDVVDGGATSDCHDGLMGDGRWFEHEQVCWSRCNS